MSRRRRERLDKLDAALDGRLVEVDEELAPLVEAAAKLRAALAGVELDPEAAERHLGMILDGEAKVVALPTGLRPQISRRRRRVAAVALAAALTVLPAIMASASALPGQALYPVKLAVEQLQVTAVSWSSTWEADERIRIANTRLDELNRLVQLRAADRILPAIVRLDQAPVQRGVQLVQPLLTATHAHPRSPAAAGVRGQRMKTGVPGSWCRWSPRAPGPGWPGPGAAAPSPPRWTC